MLPRHSVFCLLAALALSLLLSATAWCGSLDPFDPADDVPPAPDYAQPEGWLTLPDDPGRFPVDMVWIYPTVLMDDSHWLMDTSDPAQRDLARPTLVRQAGVFSSQANVYAPLYRQMNLAGLSLDEAELGQLMRYGQEDVTRALDYYLTNFNQGRPFILAGHSQGSNLLVDWALEHLGDTGAEDRLVAVYAIGWSITPADLERNPAMEMCGRSDQTGCFICYNSMEAGRQDVAPTLAPGSLAVNPLSWTTDGEFVPASRNLGAVFFAEDGSATTIPAYTSAQIVDGGLVVVPSDPEMVHLTNSLFPAGVYHAFDYSLFFENLRANAAERIEAWEAAR